MRPASSAEIRIGCIGDGQLGMMMAQSLPQIERAYPSLRLSWTALGKADGPTGLAIGQENIVVGDFADQAALAELVRRSNIITYEFENVLKEAIDHLKRLVRDTVRLAVHPELRALEIGQDRVFEKKFFRELGAETARFAAISFGEPESEVPEDFVFPAILKTRRLGYDGKGQILVQSRADLPAAVAELFGNAKAREFGLILEEKINFSGEVSLIATRDQRGNIESFPIAHNSHQKGILSQSLYIPAEYQTPAEQQLQARAEEIMKKALRELNYVGTLAIEFFVAGDRLLVNEMAPRVHNSGHGTIELAPASQFEQHVRAVAGLPILKARLDQPGVMTNVLGRAMTAEEIAALDPAARHHGYHKMRPGEKPVPGRKVEHVTQSLNLAESDSAAVRAALETIRVQHRGLIPQIIAA